MPQIKKNTHSKDIQNPNYHVYESGQSFWGLNLFKNNKSGFPITKEQHSLPIDQKLAIYNEKLAQFIEQQKINQEKEKAESK